MAKKIEGNLVGGLAFLIGVLLAVIIPLIGGTLNSTMVWILVIIGIAVGLLNVTSEEGNHFMMSGIVLIIASSLGQASIAEIPQRLLGVLNALLLIFVPATIIVAIKNVFTIARN